MVNYDAFFVYDVPGKRIMLAIMINKLT